MSDSTIKVILEMQEIISKQSRLIADLVAALESWELVAGFDGKELKERAKDLQESEDL